MGRISWTSLSSLEACGEQFRLRYEEKIKVKGSQKKFLVGRIIHEAIHAWTKAGYPTGSFGTDQIKPLLTKALSEPATGPVTDLEVQDIARKAAMGIVAAQQIYTRLAFKAHNAVVEEWHSVQIAGTTDKQWGAFDVYDPVTKTLYDLKNYTSESSHANIDQLIMYALALRKQGRPVESIAFLYPFRRRQVDVHKITQDDMDRLEGRLLAASKRVAAKAFGPPVTGDHCVWCEFWRSHFCPATARSTKAPVDGMLRFADG